MSQADAFSGAGKRQAELDGNQRPLPERYRTKASINSSSQGGVVHQMDLLETETARALLDQLLADSRLYRTGKDYRALLDFVVRLRNFAPFNAMLLDVQKPGLMYAASRLDWLERFNRTVKDGARPLLILWPFGPVALVYDVADTEGDPLPDGVAAFAAHGVMDADSLQGHALKMAKKHIAWNEVDAGDGNAGSIKVVRRSTEPEIPTTYQMSVNRNHAPNVKFATVAHELGHLFLGHLGKDKFLKVPERPPLDHAQRELEAESVSYLVCARNGVRSNSENYLSAHVKNDTTVDQIDLYQVMRAAGQVEGLLGLTAHTKYERPQKIGR